MACEKSQKLRSVYQKLRQNSLLLRCVGCAALEGRHPIASFQPMLISNQFTGSEVMKPQTIAICIISQQGKSFACRCGPWNTLKKTSAIQAYMPIWKAEMDRLSALLVAHKPSMTDRFLIGLMVKYWKATPQRPCGDEVP